MNKVLEIIDRTIGIEGGYSNHPSDRGGPTRWGVTQAKARENGYFGDMRVYPREMAVAVYLKDFWERPKIDKVNTVNTAIACEMFDTAVNMGIAWPPIFLQQALNLFNRQGRDYPDVDVDGDIGSLTLNALRAYLTKRGVTGVAVLLKVLNGLQLARYVDITKAREKNEDFFYGWVANRT